LINFRAKSCSSDLTGITAETTIVPENEFKRKYEKNHKKKPAFHAIIKDEEKNRRKKYLYLQKI
jgi:hypothetical protein